jgi:Lar family restriction alleviation protein
VNEGAKRMNKSESNVLLSCPFCGGQAVLRPSKIQVPGIHFVAICVDEDCEAEPFVQGDTEEETVKRWNTRSR